MSLFTRGLITLHSGERSDWKIECDALTDEDIETCALLLARRVGEFGAVMGIPDGGLRLAEAIKVYRTPGGLGDLILDDVLTTGASMREAWLNLKDDSYGIRGAVIFARGPCPDWVTPLFTLSEELPT